MTLAPQLIRLAEELPAAEEMGLSWQLRNLIVELPTAIASDLVQGTQMRQAAAFKLVATLELVDRVYPALDTASTRSAAESLAERLLGGGFDERLSGVAQAPVATAPIINAPATPAPLGFDGMSAPTASRPETAPTVNADLAAALAAGSVAASPTNIPVIPESAATSPVAVNDTSGASPSITPTGETNV